MDLYSAAKRLTRPFRFEGGAAPEALPIGARGVIGDGLTAALVRADGVIDWLCLPRFDSPSVFGALLDRERGGSSGVTPVRPFESLQRYDPDTNVLETLFTVPGEGVVRITDYMPWPDDPRASIHEVHRRIECCEGEVELAVTFDPRFDYGRATTTVDVRDGGVLATDGARTLVAVLDQGVTWTPRPAGGVEARVRLRPTRRAWLVLSWNAPRPEHIGAYRPFEQLRTTRHGWREWSRGLRYDGPWRHHVLRSALLLKLLMYAPTGGMVAAPTTSLPEWIGGIRNWDYRFSWTRDTAMAIRAANLIGFVRESREFFHFVRDALDRNPDLQIMYTVDGDPVPTEEVLGHLAGYRGSAPVRIGNGARSQVQHDTAGALLNAAYLHERFGGALTLRAWRHLARVVEDVRSRWRERDHGIWEPRAAPRHNVHSKLMSWVALERGAELAPLFGDAARRDAWAAAAKEVHAEVCRRGLSPAGHFAGAYGEAWADASLLLLPIHGFLPASDPRVLATVDWIRSELQDGPFLHRYRLEGGAEDGLEGREGAFVLCGFWLAEALALAGRLDEAQEVFLAHAEASNHLGLLAEEVDPASGDLLGNFPQAFSHLGLINAAVRIDLGLRLQDEGETDRPHLVPTTQRLRRINRGSRQG